MKYNYTDTIYSDSAAPFISRKKNKVGIKLRVYKKNDIKNILLAINPEGERLYIKMKPVKSGSFFQLWRATIDIINPDITYKFLIITKNNAFWYSQFGLTTHIPPDIYDFKYLSRYKPVKWLKNAVFYQIFPDRFCDGNVKTNVKDDEYVYCGRSAKAMPWGKTAKDYNPKVHLEFCGGDLAGIKQKIPYLKSLGVNALYLTPIFLSPSPHKYDVEDYYKIDPHLGTNKEFADLVKRLHKNKIKIILDGVFNHCGAAHYWFNKYGFYKSGGAYKDKNSPYYEFFKFYEHPHNYKCWMGVKTLPKLNYESEKLKDIIYRGKCAIAKYWIKPPYNTDGWRLDVANMTARLDDFQRHRVFWKEFSENIKKTRPQSYIFGEHFFDATELLQGDMLDAVMNYQGFYFPVVKWFTQKYDFPLSSKQIKINVNFKVQNLSDDLLNIRAQIPSQIQNQMYNLLNSHDTPRFYSLIKQNKKLLKGAFIFLFTYIGVPSVFYGDEVGLGGENSIDARRCMVWDEKHRGKEIYNIVQKLAALRKNNAALREGGFKELLAEGDVYSFARFAGGATIITVINKGGKKIAAIPLWHMGKIKGALKDIFNGKKYKIKNGVLKLTLDKHESLCLAITKP